MKEEEDGREEKDDEISVIQTKEEYKEYLSLFQGIQRIEDCYREPLFLIERIIGNTHTDCKYCRYIQGSMKWFSNDFGCTIARSFFFYFKIPTWDFVPFYT